MESVRDNPVTIAKSANSTGKTHGAARIATWFYKAHPASKVFTAAAPPEGNLKKLLWGELDSVVFNNPSLFESDEIGVMNIRAKDRSKDSFITGLTIPSTGTPEQREAKFSGKHAPYMLFILDEGDAIPPEVYKGIESCMTGGHVRLLVMFNPRHQSGPLERKERNGEANVVKLSAFNHPNVRTGKDLIPGAVDRNTTVRRINEWSRPLADGDKVDGECFEVPSFLVGSTALALNGKTVYPPLAAGWRKVTDPALSYMVLAEYPAAGVSQLISRADIYAAVTRWKVYVAEHGEQPPKGVRAMLGGDIAEFGDDKNVATIRYGDFISHFEEWEGMDISETGDEFIDIYREVDAYVAYIDATGVGAGVPPHMQRGITKEDLGIIAQGGKIETSCDAKRVMVASSPTHDVEIGKFGLLRDQLWWSLRIWFASGDAMIPDVEELIQELITPTYEIKNGKIKVMDKDTMKEMLSRSPNYADSLALTFAGEGVLTGMDLIAFA